MQNLSFSESILKQTHPSQYTSATLSAVLACGSPEWISMDCEKENLQKELQKLQHVEKLVAVTLKVKDVNGEMKKFSLFYNWILLVVYPFLYTAGIYFRIYSGYISELSKKVE